MNIRDGFIGMVGNTPLIKLRRPSEETGCTILADSGIRYQSNLSTQSFSRNAPCPRGLGSSDENTKWKNSLSSRWRQDDIGN
jgi:hypothetical protein